MYQQRLIGIGLVLFLILLWLGWGPPQSAAPSVSKRVAAQAPTGTPRAFLLAAATPWPAVRLDVHVEADANGEGSAHVVASSQGGQALAHIDMKGQASGRAAADAPALPGCNACASAGPLETGERPSAEGTKSEDRSQKPEAGVTPWSGQVVVVVDANLRSGPSTGSGVIGGARAGDRFAVLGRSADQVWWRVCCMVDNRPAWLYGALAEWVDPLVPLPALVTPSIPLLPFVDVPITPTPPPTPTTTWAFRIVEQEQHSEANYATIYAWVQDGNGASLAGYRLLLTKDGAPLSLAVVRFGETQPNRSTAYRQGTTRPSAPGGPEDKAYNLKLAFDPHVVGEGFTPAGAWAVQLLDPQGQPAAPLALFALRADDDHMEMYLNYGQR